MTATSVRGPVGRRIVTPKTSELIAERLRGRIARGELPTGQPLSSVYAMMAEFDVSRATMGEVLAILKAEGIIDFSRPRRDVRVVPPTAAVAARYLGMFLQSDSVTVGDVQQARITLEAGAAALLAESRTEADLADLRHCADELEVLAETAPDVGNTHSWTAVGGLFHDLVLERAGNRVLLLQAHWAEHLDLAGRALMTEGHDENSVLNLFA